MHLLLRVLISIDLIDHDSGVRTHVEHEKDGSTVDAQIWAKALDVRVPYLDS